MGLLPEGLFALPLPDRVAMNVIGEHQKSQLSETLLLPAPSSLCSGKNWVGPRWGEGRPSCAQEASTDCVQCSGQGFRRGDFYPLVRTLHVGREAQSQQDTQQPGTFRARRSNRLKRGAAPCPRGQTLPSRRCHCRLKPHSKAPVPATTLRRLVSLSRVTCSKTPRSTHSCLT